MSSWFPALTTALACAIALAGCGVERAPTRPTIPPAGVPDATMALDVKPAPQPTVTSWRCMAVTVLVSADCAPRTTFRLPPSPQRGLGGTSLLTITAAAAPVAPGALTASISGSTVHLAWSAAAGGDAPDSYVIEAGSSTGLTNLANFDTGSAALSLTANDAPAGTYFVRVRARNSAGDSAPSNEITVTVPTGGSTCSTAPGAPANLSASVTDTSVRLTWSEPSGACAPTGYIIEAGSASGLSDLANVNTGSTATSFSAAGVSPGTYFVRVRAANANGSSAASNEARLTTSTACTQPSSPSSLSAFVSGATVSLTWGAASGSPSGYIVEIGTAPGASNTAATNTGGTATSITADLPAGTYFARVRATNACGTSNPSSEVTFTIQAACTIPPAPSNLSATVSGTTVSLSWTGASAATSYVIEVGSQAGQSDVASSDTGTTATSLTTSLAEGTYFIRVRAKNACGQSGTSNEVMATVQNQTPPPPPTPTGNVITITSSGVSPRTLTVSPGTQVTFVNNDTRVHEMTSDPHPEHDQCSEINQVGFLVPGQQKQTGNLNTVRTCGFHDHLNFSSAALQGTITIR